MTKVTGFSARIINIDFFDMSAELKNNIIFFKDKPSRNWSPTPERDEDNTSKGCLNYKEMNNNFNTLEGRDIRSVSFDENCTLVLKTFDGQEIRSNGGCSDGCVLKDDLDYSEMFKVNGCCGPNGHLGWLESYQRSTEGYNHMPGDTFPAGTSIESVLRYILVGSAPEPEIECSFSANLTSPYNPEGYSWQNVEMTGFPGCSGTCDVLFDYNKAQAITRTATTSFLPKEKPESFEQNGITISNIDGLSCQSDCTKKTIRIQVHVDAQPVGPINAWYTYALSGFENPDFGNCNWNTNYIAEGYRYPLVFKLRNNVSSIETDYNIIVNEVTPQNTESYNSFIEGNKNIYYFYSEIPNTRDYIEEEYDKTYIAVLKLPSNIQWNRKILLFDNSVEKWNNISSLTFWDGNNKPEYNCDNETGYSYYFFKDNPNNLNNLFVV